MKKFLIIILFLSASFAYAADRKGIFIGKELDSFSKETVEIMINENIVALADIFFSPVGKSFIELLPLTVTMDDFNNAEKLGYLDTSLETVGMVNNLYATSGDITYYSPWNSISIFYKDFGITKDLYPIGKVRWGLDNISKQNVRFIMTIRKQK